MKKGRDLSGFSSLYQLVIDPSKRLYPLLLSWPTLSPSAETLLVSKDGNQVLFLNELRHRKGAALSLRFPLSAKNLPAARAVLGFEGTTRGIDYRGVTVLSAVKKVSGSPWFLVAKVDVDEVLQPVRDQVLVAGLVVTFLNLLAGVSVGLFWRHGRVRLYKSLYELERRYHALADRIENLTKIANDTILLLDEQHKIIEANDKAVVTYGYSRDELLELQLKDLLSPDEVPFLEIYADVALNATSTVFDTYFPVMCPSLFHHLRLNPYAETGQ